MREEPQRTKLFLSRNTSYMEKRDFMIQLETELTDMRETFREYMQAENEWGASMFCEMHEINAARENVLALKKKAKEVLGL